MTDSRSAGTGKGNTRKHKNAAEGLSVSETAPRRPGCEAESAPIRLRYKVREGDAAAWDGDAALSDLVLELPVSELARLMPQKVAVKLYPLVRKLLAIPEGPCFPYTLAELIRCRPLLKALRSKLPFVKHLSELIIDPPAILIDEGQKLFFYRGIPVWLRPVSFNYMLLLAQCPGKLVLRDIIYRCLWPGEMNFEGTDKPYKRQITDQKRKLLGDIRRGITGKMEIREGEMESLIVTRPKMGYLLNLDRKEVLAFSQEGLLLTVVLIWISADRLFREWFGGAFCDWNAWVFYM